jgi:single-strand DNA-binding protein
MATTDTAPAATTKTPPAPRRRGHPLPGLAHWSPYQGPQLRYTPNGTAVASFRIVNNATDELQFHNIIAWRGVAEIAAEHLSKGRLVYVGGRLHSRSWTGRNGVSCWELEIIADEILFLTPKPHAAPAAAAA